jgi:hypothetical protein
MFLSGRDWETSQDRGREILDEIYYRALRTSDSGEGSLSNRIMTLSTQPRQRRSGFEKSL